MASHAMIFFSFFSKGVNIFFYLSQASLCIMLALTNQNIQPGHQGVANGPRDKHCRISAKLRTRTAGQTSRTSGRGDNHLKADDNRLERLARSTRREIEKQCYYPVRPERRIDLEAVGQNETITAWDCHRQNCNWKGDCDES
ncbi:MAG: hypothetical protein L3J03_09865 [Desulfobacterales bacterium]|nr:hypothetical protein [Desulfobacterales bacterium]